MSDGYLRGSLPRTCTARQVDVLAAFVAAGGSVQDAADLVGIRPSTVKTTPRRPAGQVRPYHRAVDLRRMRCRVAGCPGSGTPDQGRGFTSLVTHRSLVTG